MKYNWSLKDYPKNKNGYKVFSCFACGGGSTMGYKLAGFDVIGCNEIDPKMNACYIENHSPKHNYLEDIRIFKERDDLPQELYDLDILDGSPPCSSFSMAGNREKDWGSDKKFREGQANQVLDTLFFDFIELAEKLQPKIIIAENVKGLLFGEAKKYLIKIIKSFENAGYKVVYKVLNGSKMGLPQRRERVFFMALRNDLMNHVDCEDMFNTEPSIKLNFNEKPIPYKDIRCSDQETSDMYKTPKSVRELWGYVETGSSFSSASEIIKGKAGFFSYKKAHPERVIPTIAAHTTSGTMDYEHCRFLTKKELLKAGSFPTDYNFKSLNPKYLIGMSVPPLMMAKLAIEVKTQWLERIEQ